MFSEVSGLIVELLGWAEPFTWPFIFGFSGTCFAIAAACLLVLTPGESVMICVEFGHKILERRLLPLLLSLKVCDHLLPRCVRPKCLFIADRPVLGIRISSGALSLGGSEDMKA